MNNANKDNGTRTLVFHGVVYDGIPVQMAIDGVGGAMAIDGSVEKGANDAVCLSLECTLELDGIKGLPHLTSAKIFRAEFGPEGRGAEDNVIGYTTTTAIVSSEGKLIHVRSVYETIDTRS